jgi:hypothetical protein
MSDPASPDKAPTGRTTASDLREHPRFKAEGANASLGRPGILAGLGLGPRKHPVVNLSQGGVMIQLGKRLPIGSRHPLRLEVPKCKEWIEVQGEVRWCLSSAKSESDIYVGLRFVDLSPADRRKLAGMHDLFTSAEYKAKAVVRKEASSMHLRAPRI